MSDARRETAGRLRRMVDDFGGRPGWVRYSVTGARGAVNLTFMAYPPGWCWTGADFGVHSPKPLYDGDSPQDGVCELLGEVPCYYDGSGLRADQYVHLHEAGDEDGIYAVLEADYLSQFGTYVCEEDQ